MVEKKRFEENPNTDPVISFSNDYWKKWLIEKSEKITDSEIKELKNTIKPFKKQVKSKEFKLPDSW